MVSHDLRTPLTAITGFAELARGLAGTADPRLADFLERIEINARQMAVQIDGLLALSRLQRSEEPDAEIDPRAMFAELLEAAHPPASGELRVDTRRRFRAPAEMTRKLFGRLVDNALVHSGRVDVTVAVTIVDADGGVVVTVDDDGRGIPPEEVATALAPFGRLDADATEGRAGMGLTLAERAATILGAGFDIDQRPGGGCRITVTIPPERVTNDA